VRIQTGRDNNPSDAVASIVREEGVAGLWAGWSAYFVLALKPAIEYAVYEQVGAFYHSQNNCCWFAIQLSTACTAFSYHVKPDAPYQAQKRGKNQIE
jgi:hypothetical protein